MEKSLLTVREAGDILSLGKTKLYQLMGSGELPVVRVGRAVRLPRVGIEAWIAREVERAAGASGR